MAHVMGLGFNPAVPVFPFCFGVLSLKLGLAHIITKIMVGF